MKDSLSVTALEGREFEVVPAEGITEGDLIVSGGPTCGIRDVFEVLAFGTVGTFNNPTGDVVLHYEDVYESRDSMTVPGDQLIIRAKRS